MSLFYRDHDYEDADLRAEVMAERRRRAQWNHWCDLCHGHIGPGSPCAPDDEEEEEEEDGCRNAPAQDEEDGE